ncbi:substrate-binding domain-containing protein [Patulibacter sp. S7RM1-6]
MTITLSPRRALTAVLVAVGLAVPLAGCGAASDDGAVQSNGMPEKLRVGAVFMDSQGFYGGVRYGFEQAAKAQGVDLTMIKTNAAGDASTENQFLSTIANSEPDAIIVSASSETASVPAIRAAHKLGVPVVCYNACVNEADMKRYVYAYALGSPERFGALIGDAAGKYFAEKGVTAPKIGVVNCETVEVCKRRETGFEAALTKRVPGARVVSNQEGATEDKAITVAQNILNSHPDLDAFFGQAGGATAGAARAVQASGRIGKTVVFGGDMTLPLARLLADGRIVKGIVDISGRVMGERAFRLSVDAKLGKQRSEIVEDVPIDLYTADDRPTVEEWLETHKNGLP